MDGDYEYEYGHKFEVDEWGHRLGFKDGRTAAMFIRAGKPVDHGDLLSANDPYAVGYRAGLNGEPK